ncbi:MAG: Outer rane receptor protein, partial [Novosphingobium sp.]|nr:Outer rane receptor protein [Novosphingobium sp.]
MTNRTGRIRQDHKRGLLLGAAALALPATMMPAFAQDSAPAEVSNSNEILVTAQRRTERLEDVPMAVQVVSPETLASAGINSVRDLANVTSGFQIGNSGSYPQPAIRGITTINAGAYENNIAVFVDGLYQFTPQILNMDLPNVQSIQVLKGPQSTLYGRNATGGAILIDTIDPTSVWKGMAEATYGSFNDRRARGYAAGPLSDSVGFSVAGTFRRTDGYYKLASRTTPGQFDGNTFGLKQESIRAKLKADITSSFRATLGYSYVRASDPRGVIFTPIENVSGPYTGGNATRPRGRGEIAGDAFDLDFKQHEGSLKLELDTGIGMLRSTTGYTHGILRTTYDADGSYAAGTYSDSLIHDKTFQESVDFTINAIHNLDLIVGGNYYHITSEYAPDKANVAFTANGQPVGTPLSSYLRLQEILFWRTKQAYAGFVDATFHATDRLSINLGGRYSSETQDVAAEKHVFCTVAAGCTDLGGTVPLGAIRTGTVGTPYTRANSAQTSTYSKFTPRASIRYEISPRTNIYLSYSQGFRSGEWNSVPPSDTNLALWRTNGQVGQESVNAFELGIKSAGSRLRFDASAFYYDYSDLQLSTTVFVGGLAVVSLQQVPKAKIYGIEANIDFDVTDNFKVRAGGTFLHARYGDRAVFVGSSVNPLGVGYNPNSDPLKVFPNVPQVAQDLSGKQMARAPNFSGFLGAEYSIPHGEGGLVFAANVKYTTSYAVTEPTIWGGEPLAAYNARLLLDPKALPNNNVTLAGTPYVSRANEERARQTAFALVNASVTWTDPSNHYYVRAWGNNL